MAVSRADIAWILSCDYVMAFTAYCLVMDFRVIVGIVYCLDLR